MDSQKPSFQFSLFNFLVPSATLFSFFNFHFSICIGLSANTLFHFSTFTFQFPSLPQWSRLFSFLDIRKVKFLRHYYLKPYLRIVSCHKWIYIYYIHKFKQTLITFNIENHLCCFVPQIFFSS